MNDRKQFEIEKGIPVPTTRQGNYKYPWDEMEVGDSFFIKGKVRAQIAPSIKRIEVTRGVKFTAHQVEDGLRVWRIA